MNADSWLGRLGGLLVRPVLKAEEVLWLRPCQSIHTFGMRYAIAVLFLDKDNTVIDIRPRVSPNRIAFCMGAHSVCEMLPFHPDHSADVVSELSYALSLKTAT